MTTVPQDPSGTLPALGDAYTIERELGGGGMSRVFVAIDRALERKVVVKLLSTEVAQGLSAERFAREIKLAAQLQDPHIVPVLATGTTLDGVPYYTMPFVPGESLRARMNAGTVPLEESLRILRDVAEALEHAHEQGVVHRDIKPENILISGRNAVVADFGIAKALTAARSITAEQAAATLTSVGMSLGTPRYMAPEQAAGDPADHRADLYAWGMIAYELLAGVHPFAAKTTTQQLIVAQITELPRPLDEVRPGLPPTLGTLVMQCLAKHAADRPENTTALLAELAGAASGSTSGARTGATGATMPSAAPTRSRRGLVLAGVGLLAVLGAGGVVMKKRSTAMSDVAAANASPSLAVLPFEHQGDSADVYLTEGITDEIRGKLSGVRDLLVIARASSNSYRNTKKTPREIAEELGVRYLLTGTVRVVGSGAERRVIVRPELVEITREGQPQSKWGQPFDVGGADVLGLQGEVAQQVVSAMEVPGSGAGDARNALVVPATRDPQAYDLYLRGQAAIGFGASTSPSTLRTAIALLEQAVARDSTYAQAWAALATHRANLYFKQASPVLAVAARTAAERAQALDPGGATSAKAMSAYLKQVARDAPGALAASERAVQAAPGDAAAATNLAQVLLEVGRVDEALQLFEITMRREPRRPTLLGLYSQFLLLAGRPAEARAAAERLRALAPLSPMSISRRAEVELYAGDTIAARRVLAEALRNVPEDELLPALLELSAGALLDPTKVRTFLARGPVVAGGERWLWLKWQAEWAWRAGDSTAWRTWGDSARRELARQLRALPTDEYLRVSHAQALAHSGRRAEALREAREAVAMVLRRGTDRRSGTYLVQLFGAAQTAVLAGDHSAAIAWLEEGQALPLHFSRALLRVDPWLSPLRGNPRFERLTAEAPR